MKRRNYTETEWKTHFQKKKNRIVSIPNLLTIKIKTMYSDEMKKDICLKFCFFALILLKRLGNLKHILFSFLLH